MVKHLVLAMMMMMKVMIFFLRRRKSPALRPDNLKLFLRVLPSFGQAKKSSSGPTGPICKLLYISHESLD